MVVRPLFSLDQNYLKLKVNNYPFLSFIWVYEIYLTILFQLFKLINIKFKDVSRSTFAKAEIGIVFEHGIFVYVEKSEMGT